MPEPTTPDTPPGRPARQYLVVARRYRPQAFGELLGQEHVAQGFQRDFDPSGGPRLPVQRGARRGQDLGGPDSRQGAQLRAWPAPIPCNECDICRSISAGDDVDVLEIDGASNRGIDEIRQLRQNVNVRPSRSRFKIYIIDEVHMLTREAFNALLKTLEEPPEHVKFIFCTTEPTKIPITILSRCQRFDFAGISTRSISSGWGRSSRPRASRPSPRRWKCCPAGGRLDGDSQSLLEQLLAFAPERITVADVHGMLGTAGEERLGTILDHLVQRNAAAAMAELDAAVNEGVDVGQLLEQLFGYFRDCLLSAVGCPTEAFL